MAHDSKIRLSGFTILRNGASFGYPFLESLKCLFDVCDEVVLNLGISTDDTKSQILDWLARQPEAQQKKLVLFETEWPLHLKEKREGGQILAEQTNLALKRCQGAWCLYLQADEILHEEDYPKIRAAVESQISVPNRRANDIDAFVFRYLHFYANYQTIQKSRSAYRREVRLIRNHRDIKSVGDAQGFLYADGRKIPAALIDARVFHYGWVRPPEVMRKKTGFMDTLYHQGATEEIPVTGENYKYKRFFGLSPFVETHPAVMQARIDNTPFFNLADTPLVFEIKDTLKILSYAIERITGWRPFEYRNYRLVR